jgi:hypothetical protein
MYLNPNMYMNMNVCAQKIHTFVHAYANADVYAYTQTHVRMYVLSCHARYKVVHVYTNADMYVCVCMYVCTYHLVT